MCFIIGLLCVDCVPSPRYKSMNTPRDETKKRDNLVLIVKIQEKDLMLKNLDIQNHT